MKEHNYRAIWLSDIHLGFKDCKADFLLDFLSRTKTEQLFLIGDIVDMWSLSKKFHWPQSHNQVLQKLLKMPSKGVKTVYLPGNHDELAKPYDQMLFGDIEVHNEYLYETVDGKKLLLMHGDAFDEEVCLGKWQAWLGDKLYEILLWLNRWYNRISKRFGYKYWSLAGYIKSNVKGVEHAIQRFRQAAVNRAKERGADGIICGHIHQAEIMEIDGFLYCNDGDWIETCSAIAETHDGHLELIYWTEECKKEFKVKPLTLVPNKAKAA